MEQKGPLQYAQEGLLRPVLDQTNSVSNTLACLSKILLNIIHQPTSRFSWWSLSFRHSN
jgi:hypothetical protein